MPEAKNCRQNNTHTHTKKPASGPELLWLMNNALTKMEIPEEDATEEEKHVSKLLPRNWTWLRAFNQSAWCSIYFVTPDNRLLMELYN